MHSRWRKTFKFALVGCGKTGHSHATIIHNHPKTDLAAVIDTNPDAARAFGASFGCKSYTSVEEYLSGGRIADCAVVCAYPSENSDIAVNLMQRRMHVLCEQPFALDSASARKMADVARTYGVHLTVGSKFRYVPDIVHARGLIQAGILGHVIEFKGDFRDLVDMRNQWYSQPQLSGGGVLMDRGGNAVDIVRNLFGSVRWVHAEEGQRIQSGDVEDTVRLELRTESGIMGTVHLSWTLKSSGDDYFRIYGTQGSLCIGWKKSMYRPNAAVDWINFGEGFSTMKALTLQLTNFVNAVAEGETLDVDAGDALESAHIIEAAYQSLRTGQRLELNAGSRPVPAPPAERRLSVVLPGRVS